MATATWNGTVIAESDDTVVVEGNHYFPRSALHGGGAGQPVDHGVPVEGHGHYLDLVSTARSTRARSGTTPSRRTPRPQIKDRVAFWRGVDVDG